MTKLLCLCLAASVAVPGVASNRLSIPPIQGRTAACQGRFTHTDTTLSWNTSFAKCSASYKIGQFDGHSWVLIVETSKTCPYEIIEVGKPIGPRDTMYTLVGFLKDHNLDNDRLLCAMYAAKAKEMTP